MESFDAIVVGSGPGGATAARDLARKNRSVLILEKHALPRHKACGGGLTGNVTRHLDFSVDPIVENSVSRTLFMFQGRATIMLEPKDLHVEMIQRDHFDHFLTRKAIEAGAVLKQEETLRKFTRVNGHYEVETTRGSYRAGVIIGADGAASTTARRAGLRKSAELGYAMDADLKVPENVYREWSHTAIFDFGVVPRGYGWSFPKGSFFSIGVGTVNRRFPDIKAQIQELIDRHECLQKYVSIEVRAAPLPFWTHHEPLARDGVFLVGDAAGLVDPLSGEGISYAIRSAHAAANFAEEHLGGAPATDSGYSDEIFRTISKGFQFASRLSQIFFDYPRLCYAIGVRSQRVNDIFAKLIVGQIDYVELYEEVAASAPGRIYRMLKPLLRRLK